jgi:hypothetical protein
MEKITLKGGSLSSTSLIIIDKKKFVRKEVSVTKNREYGYQRWYSQLKRIQRYNVIFPGLYPQLIEYGLLGDDIAYFDIEYIENSQTGYEFLLNETNTRKIEIFFENLILSMNLMHEKKFSSTPSSINLYLMEEVDRKIMDCMAEKSILEELTVDFFLIDNKKIKNIINNINIYKTIFTSSYNQSGECFTHGNITLENIMYDHINNKIKFIDPYDENIIDSKLAEYSQILQSSNAKYEFINNNNVCIDSFYSNNKIFGLDYFNELFNKFLKDSLTVDEIKIVKLFEISQFIRMLPFKLEIDKHSMLKFIKVASILMNQYKNEYQ